MTLFLEEAAGGTTQTRILSKGNSVQRQERTQHLFKLYSKSQNDFNSEKDVPKNLFEEKKKLKEMLTI